MSRLSVSQLYEDLREELALSVLSGESGMERRIGHTRFQKNGLPLAGFLKAVHPDRVQVWGSTEIGFLEHLEEGERAEAARRYFRLPLCAVLVTGGRRVFPDIAEASAASGVPILVSGLPGEDLLPKLSEYLQEHLSLHARLHGVLVDLYGVGVLIQGKSGIGKSECALHLVTRGHRLVADDVVDIQLRGHELVGKSTDLLKHHIEVRGLGVLNLKDLFGVVAIRYEKNVDIVVELVPWTPDSPFERLGIDIETQTILDKPLPRVRIPVAPGRNIPTLIEVAARNLLLQRMGYFSAQEFSRALSARIALESTGAGSEKGWT